MWKVKFRPILIIPWHLEEWPAEPLPLRSIWKLQVWALFPNFRLRDFTLRLAYLEDVLDLAKIGIPVFLGI